MISFLRAILKILLAPQEPKPNPAGINRGPGVQRRPPRPQEPKPNSAGIKHKLVDLDFMESVGQYAESADGRYRLTWSEFSGDGNDPHGAYVLMRGNSKLCSGKLERPYHGKVARNGTFILTDDCFGNALKSRVYGFSASGEQLLKHEFRANSISVGISDSGKYAVVQLAQAPSRVDGGALVFLDLAGGEILWQKKPETGTPYSRWPDSYWFDDKTQTLGLVYEQFGTFRYSYENGSFEDSERWDQSRIRHGSGQVILAVGKEKLAACSGNISSADAEELLVLCKKAFDKQDVQDDDRIIAKAFRLSGEIHEQAGNLHQAIEQYENALDVDEKVGVKLKLRRLRKSLI